MCDLTKLCFTTTNIEALTDNLLPEILWDQDAYDASRACSADASPASRAIAVAGAPLNMHDSSIILAKKLTNLFVMG